MVKTIVGVDGMMCGMCESHVNEAVRKAFPKAKKVTSSHSKGQTVIRSQEALDQAQLRQVIDATGYKALDVVSRPVEKRGLLGHLKK